MGEGTRTKKIAIALSGGGFRATLFHLGALLYLRDSGALPSVTCLASVSGGSITAAYALLRWQEFQDEAVHYDVVHKLIALAQCNVVGKVLLGFGSRTTRLQTLYARKLFGQATLDSLGPDRPKLYVMGTNLTTGESLAFSPDGHFLGSKILDGKPVEKSFKIARAVAASSAFPVLFPALKLPRIEFGLTHDEMKVDQLWVTDGGVWDNSGLEFLRGLRNESAMESKAPVFDILISMDARRKSDLSAAGEKRIFGLRLPSVLERAFEIATSALDGCREEQNKEATFVRLVDKSTARFGVADDIRRLLRFVRTDFNKFTNAEVFALIAHGYAVTADKLVNLAPLPPGSVPVRNWEKTLGWPVPNLSTRDFRKSADRRFWLQLRVPASLLIIACFLSISAWLHWHWSVIPSYSEHALKSQSALDITEPWMRSVLNDLEREARPSSAKAFARPSNEQVGVGVLRWSPFIKRAPGTVLEGKYDAGKYRVSASGFLKTSSAERVLYVPLVVVVKDGHITIAFTGACPDDELVLVVAAAAKAGDTPPFEVAQVFSDWGFYANTK